MDFPRLTFPLTADFGSAGYWIGGAGPFPYGAAVTALFCGDDLMDNAGGGLLLMRGLEDVLNTFGGHQRVSESKWNGADTPIND